MSNVTKKEIHYRAEFLNKPFFEEDGSIFSKLIVDTKEEGYGWDCTLKIRDCSNTVSIDTWIKSQDDLDNLLFKLTVMIEHLKELREVVQQNGQEYVNTLNEKRKSNAISDSDAASLLG